MQFDKSLSRKQMALLIYLVCAGRSFRRKWLATLLWGKCGQSQALYNLRRALYQIGHELCLIDLDRRQFLIVSPDSVQFYPKAPYSLDVQEFKEGATELYAPFLDTFSINNAIEFEEWRRQECAIIDVIFETAQTANKLLQPLDIIEYAQIGCSKLFMGHWYIAPDGIRYKLLYALATSPITVVLEQHGGQGLKLPAPIFKSWFKPVTI